MCKDCSLLAELSDSKVPYIALVWEQSIVLHLVGMDKFYLAIPQLSRCHCPSNSYLIQTLKKTQQLPSVCCLSKSIIFKICSFSHSRKKSIGNSEKYKCSTCVNKRTFDNDYISKKLQISNNWINIWSRRCQIYNLQDMFAKSSCPWRQHSHKWLFSELLSQVQ